MTNISFSGIVIHGKKLWRTIGYPTANIFLSKWIIGDGVYSLGITVSDTLYSWIGTYRESISLFEAHIFDFDADIYGEMIQIHIHERIRDNQHFDSLESLKIQIHKDAEKAKWETIYPTLDTIVLKTLDLYRAQEKLPKLDLSIFKNPLVVWSGNGYYTGRILFRNLGAFFATESDINDKLSNSPAITDVVVISASGEKHAPIILKAAKDYQKNTFLISSSEKSSGRDIANSSIIMPKIREPYTYNTSTYFGYMLAENPDIDLEKLQQFILEDFEQAIQDIHFSDYSSFFIVLPDQFVLLREMIETKFIELFGRKVAHDTFTYEQMKHATTVVQDENELFLCFGNKTWIQYGNNQINLPIFDITHYAAMMLVGYTLVGKIQKSLPPYFMNSIQDYCMRAKTQSGFNIAPWVEV